MRYAVAEWQGKYEDADGWVDIVGKDLTEYQADLLIRITPVGYTREKITMQEYEEAK